MWQAIYRESGPTGSRTMPSLMFLGMLECSPQYHWETSMMLLVWLGVTVVCGAIWLALCIRDAVERMDED